MQQFSLVYCHHSANSSTVERFYCGETRSIQPVLDFTLQWCIVHYDQLALWRVLVSNTVFRSWDHVLLTVTLQEIRHDDPLKLLDVACIVLASQLSHFFLISPYFFFFDLLERRGFATAKLLSMCPRVSRFIRILHSELHYAFYMSMHVAMTFNVIALNCRFT